jgi:hypothetical protein
MNAEEAGNTITEEDEEEEEEVEELSDENFNNYNCIWFRGL